MLIKKSIEYHDTPLHVEFEISHDTSTVDIYNIRVINDVGQPCGPDLRPLLTDVCTYEGIPLNTEIAYLLGARNGH